MTLHLCDDIDVLIYVMILKYIKTFAKFQKSQIFPQMSSIIVNVLVVAMTRSCVPVCPRYTLMHVTCPYICV